MGIQTSGISQPLIVLTDISQLSGRGWSWPISKKYLSINQELLCRMTIVSQGIL
jgi:hypothetical protein